MAIPLQARRQVPLLCRKCETQLSLRRILPRQQTQRLSTAHDSPTNPPLPPLSGVAKLTNRRIIAVHGTDASKFLHSLVAASVSPSLTQSGFYTTFLSAQGRVLYDVFVFPTSQMSRWIDGDASNEPGYLIDVDSNQAENLYRHLRRYKLRAKVKLRLLAQEELGVWSQWDEMDASQGEVVNTSDSLALHDTRAPGMGMRHLLPSQAESSTLPTLLGTQALCDLPTYTLRRYLHGVAEGQSELPFGVALPHSSNIDIMQGIDFKKGCYIGQELTIRTQHTGVVRRRILPIRFAIWQGQGETEDASIKGLSSESFKYDASFHSDAANGDSFAKVGEMNGKQRSAGKVLGVIGNVGLGLCNLAVMTDLAITAERMTFRESTRFNIEGKRIAVAAHVPPWMRERIPGYRPVRRVAY